MITRDLKHLRVETSKSWNVRELEHPRVGTSESWETQELERPRVENIRESKMSESWNAREFEVSISSSDALHPRVRHYRERRDGASGGHYRERRDGAPGGHN